MTASNSTGSRGRDHAGDLTQNEMQGCAVPNHREAVIHFLTGGQRGQIVPAAQLSDVVIAVAADQEAVGIPVADRLQASLGII